MKRFTKKEFFGLAVIFLILVGVSVPNFIVSLRKARDQVRKDDMGALQKVLGEYQKDFQVFPLASDDGKIVACKNEGDVITRDEFGGIVGNLVPCEWGKDAIADLTQENGKVYMRLLPREPNYEDGVSYRYFSDGSKTQIFVSLEGKDEPEYEEKIVTRGVMCGNLICNAGRDYGCPPEKSLEECVLEEQVIGKE